MKDWAVAFVAAILIVGLTIYCIKIIFELYWGLL